MINDQRFNKLFSTASFSNASVRAYLECILGVNCTLHPHLVVSECINLLQLIVTGEVDDLFDFAKIDFSDFDFLDQVLHILNGLFGGFLIRGGD